MPTYSEALFEPLEAWIENELPAIAAEVDYPLEDDGRVAELRLIVSKMLLEHAGRGSNPVIRLEQGRMEITEAEAEELRAQLRSRLGGAS